MEQTPLDSTFNIPEKDQRAYANAYFEAVWIAKNYDGREQSFDRLFSMLIEMETVAIKILGGTPGRGVCEADERTLCTKIMGRGVHPQTTDEILEIAQTSLALKIDPGASTRAIAESLGIFCRDVAGAFVPPDEPLKVLESGSSRREFQAKRWVPRIPSLISALQSMGVFIDDLILKVPTESGSRWRYPGYSVLEIPRLGYAQILLSNEVGAGTRVTSGPLSESTYVTATKRELDRIPGVSTVVCLLIDNWTSAVTDLLKRSALSSKIPVRLVEDVRQRVSQMFTVEEFFRIPWAQIRTIEYEDRSLGAVAEQLCSSIQDTAQDPRAALAMIIYGYEKVPRSRRQIKSSQPADLAIDYSTYNGDWKGAIERSFPSRESFVAELEKEPLSLARSEIVQLLYAAGLISSTDLEHRNVEVLKRIYPSSGTLPLGGINFRSSCWLRGLEGLDLDLRWVETEVQLGRISPRLIFALEIALDAIRLRIFKNAVDTNEDPSTKLKVLDAAVTRVEKLREEVFETASERRLIAGAESSFSCFTPVCVDPAWGLDPQEALMMQLLVNEGPVAQCDLSLFTDFFDPTGTKYTAMRGPVGKIVNSLSLKLESKVGLTVRRDFLNDFRVFLGRA